MKNVVVGSENPVKIQAVKEAFTRMWPDEDWHVSGINAASGVADQPMFAEESVQGATQRARTALAHEDADFGVGLEGGLQEVAGSWFDIGWIVVVDQAGVRGIAPTVGVCIPEQVMAHVRAGKEVGAACDEVFGTVNSKQANGAHGLLTKDRITRTDAYRDGVLSALSAFIHSDPR